MNAPGEHARRVKLEGLPEGMTLVRQLGSSPLSEVFLVADNAGRLLALKVLRPSPGRDPRIRERWRREAQLLEELSHPNLVHSFGALEVQGRPALLLEYIEGKSLRERLKQGPLGWEEATRIGVQVARALQLLHRHGALHRDVKPHNILMDAQRGAVLADLGLVRRREDPTLTAPGAALGSPAYMSPEQARDPSDVGPEADAYSLGATLYHALAGKPPFLGQGVGEVIHRVLHTDPEPLPASVPAPLREVLAIAMAKDPEERYAQARDLANDLGRVLLGTPPLMVTRRKRRRRLKTAGLAAAVLSLVGAGTWVLLQGGSGPPAPADGDAGLALAPAGESAPRAPDLDPERGAEAREREQARVSREQFQRWAARFEPTYSGYLAAGRLRDALEEISLLEEIELPAHANDHFRHLWTVLLREARQAVFATAEQAAVDAEGILEEYRAPALAAVAAGDFDGAAWAQSVEAAWEESRLPLEDLPLRPGGSNPRQRLELARRALEREFERQQAVRLAFMVQRVRAATGKKLRAGRFSELKADWQVWKEEYAEQYLRSPEARREKTRVDELARLEEKFFERLDNLRDTEVRLDLRLARLTGRVLVPELQEDGYRLDLGTRQLPLRLQDMDPARLGEFLLRDPDEKNFRWTLAHLYWSQGETERALELLSDMAFREFPFEMDPGFWEAEWRKELALAADGAASGPAGAAAGEGGAEPALPLPEAELAREWQRVLPGARVEAVEGGVEITWEDPRWGELWSQELRFPRRRWRPEAWRVEWQLPPGGAAPRSWSWTGQVQWERPPGTGLPRLRVGDRFVEGYDLVPGALQSLEWRNGRVYFDGVEVAGLAAREEDSRLRLQAAAAPAFRPARVWLRLAPRAE